MKKTGLHRLTPSTTVRLQDELTALLRTLPPAGDGNGERSIPPRKIATANHPSLPLWEKRVEGEYFCSSQEKR